MKNAALRPPNNAETSGMTLQCCQQYGFTRNDSKKRYSIDNLYKKFGTTKIQSQLRKNGGGLLVNKSACKSKKGVRQKKVCITSV